MRKVLVPKEIRVFIRTRMDTDGTKGVAARIGCARDSLYHVVLGHCSEMMLRRILRAYPVLEQTESTKENVPQLA